MHLQLQPAAAAKAKRPCESIFSNAVNKFSMQEKKKKTAKIIFILKKKILKEERELGLEARNFERHQF